MEFYNLIDDLKKVGKTYFNELQIDKDKIEFVKEMTKIILEMVNE